MLRTSPVGSEDEMFVNQSCVAGGTDLVLRGCEDAVKALAIRQILREGNARMLMNET